MSAGDGRIRIHAPTVVTRLTDGGDLGTGEVPLILDHPAVSRRHALLVPAAGGVQLQDQSSMNGTFVNRRRLTAPRKLAAADVVEIGPFRLLFDGAQLVRLSRGNHNELVMRDVAKDVRRAGAAASERILQPLSLRVRPDRVTCIIGASGSGKSTLLNIMAGRLSPSQGSVFLGNVDLHQHFVALKNDIAYLPQAETVHELLTVRQALRYSAQLRLPRETTQQALEAAVAEAAAAVGLHHRIDAPIASLSGGQRKRACLAVEILARPGLLFLDEATSGLDEVTDREVMTLLKRLAREGTSIVCVTHTLANLHDSCDDLIVLEHGGRLAFAGEVAAALRHFRAETLGDVLAELEEHRQRNPPVPAAPSTAPAESPSALPKPQTRRPSLPDLVHHLRVLVRRNLRLMLADRRTLALAGVQSIVVGALLGYAFSDFGDAEPLRLASQRASLLLLGITALWMGCNTGSKEIVGEREILLRERDVGVSAFSFVLAKFSVAAIFASAQVLALCVVTATMIDSLPGGMLRQTPILLLAGLSGLALGLLISSVCTNRNQASVIVPLAVAPQLILGGGLAPMLPEPARDLARVAISAWQVRLVMERIAGIAADDSIGGHYSVLLAQMLVFLIAACAITAKKRRD